jgi:hypothetical protein
VDVLTLLSSQPKKLYDLADGKEIRPQSRTGTKSSFKNSHTSQFFKIRWLQTIPLQAKVLAVSLRLNFGQG